jgi:hypothetical protein
MSRMTALRRVHLQNMKRLTNIAPLCTAPALEDLLVFDFRHLQPEHFECFADHPTLKHAVVALGARRKNEAVGRIFDLARSGEFAFR